MWNTWEQRVQRDGIVHTVVPIGAPHPAPGEVVERLVRAISARTKVLLISHVSLADRPSLARHGNLSAWRGTRACSQSWMVLMGRGMWPLTSTPSAATSTERAVTSGSWARLAPDFFTHGVN